MNRRLLIDGIRRSSSFLAVEALIAGAIWLAASAGIMSVGAAMASSMALAQLFGPGMAIRQIAPREVLALPMSRLEIWRTRFWFSSAVVVSVATIGKLVG